MLQSISALKQRCIFYNLNIKLSVPGFQTIWNGTSWNKNQQHQKLRGSESLCGSQLSIHLPPSILVLFQFLYLPLDFAELLEQASYKNIRELYNYQFLTGLDLTQPLKRFQIKYDDP